MNTNTMELNLNEMELVTGGRNWKEALFGGIVGGVAGAGIGANAAGIPGAVVGGVIGIAVGVACTDPF